MPKHTLTVTTEPAHKLTTVDRRFSVAEPSDPRDALATYNAVRRALGARSDVGTVYRGEVKPNGPAAAGWATVGAANSKMGKSRELLIGGITTLPHRSAARWFAAADPSVRAAVARAVGLSQENLRRALAATVCPHSTPGCRAVCLITEAGREERARVAAGDAWWNLPIARAQLARTIVTLARPWDALALELESIVRHAEFSARLNLSPRWRVNVADDIARESNRSYVAALDILADMVGGPAAYSYSKRWNRPEVRGIHRICLSATENHTVGDIAAALAAGRTVAVPLLGIGKRDPMPPTFHGLPLTDGDVSDDRTADPAGSVVGLRVKGQRAATLRHGGFLRPWAP